MFDLDFVKNTLTPILAIIGAIFGLLGTGMGFFNLYLNWKSHWTRVKLEFSAEGYESGSNPNREMFYQAKISVINKSYFPITVKEAGLVMKQSVFSRRTYMAGFGFNRERIDARDSHGGVLSVRSSSTTEPAYSSYFVTPDDVDGAIAVYAVLVDGTRIVSRRGVKKTIREVKNGIEDYERRIAAEKEND